jgi:hypothetical protein
MNEDQQRIEDAINHRLAQMAPADRLRACQMAKFRAEGRTEEDVRERMERQARKMNRRARLARSAR